MLLSPYFSPSAKAQCSSKILKVSPVSSSPTYFELYCEVCQRKPLLIQEIVAGDPWKLLVAVTLLNKTSGKIAIPVFWDIIARWPTPLMLSRVDENELIDTIQRLGTQNIRAKRLILLSRAYLQDPPSLYDFRPSKPGVVTPTKSTKSPFRPKARYPPTPISHLPGTGPYALDSYRIFCTLHHDPSSNEWKNVTPTDKELIRFLARKWKWAVAEHRQWSATSGLGGTATTAYFVSLISDLTSLN